MLGAVASKRMCRDSSIEARKADVNADGAVDAEDMIIVRGRLGKR